MDLLTIAHPEQPAFDMALTGALLYAVARERAPETVRIFRPGPTLAFGRMDRRRAGFVDACRAALAHGRKPVVRLGGGHAAAYNHDCVLVEVVRRHEHSLGGSEDRFADMVGLVQEALARLGVVLELGELPGEYCPGRYSLHLPSGPKVAGVAQRVLRHASLTTAVIVVRGGDTLRDTLNDVYDALELPLDTRATGAVSDHQPHVTVDLAAQVVLETAADRYQAMSAHVGSETLQRANKLLALDSIPRHRQSPRPEHPTNIMNPKRTERRVLPIDRFRFEQRH
jgi:lipoate-protein ligase A